MANNTAAFNGELFASEVQTAIQERFIGEELTNSRYMNSFFGNDLVHFPRTSVPALETMASGSAVLTPVDIAATDDTFALDNRWGVSFDMSKEEQIEIASNPKAEIYRGISNNFIQKQDDNIFGQYGNAGITVDDGNLGAATNGGAGNAATLSSSNIWDYLRGVSQSMDEANLSAADRWIVLDPKRIRMIKADTNLLSRDTTYGEDALRRGYVLEADGFKIYVSNNLTAAAGTTHILAGQGKPISFAANIKPQIDIVDAKYIANKFVDNFKAMTKFGSKVFYHDQARLVDCQVTT